MTLELAKEIFNDILNCNDLIDVEKSDALSFMRQVYPKEFNAIENINEVIDDLD